MAYKLKNNLFLNVLKRKLKLYNLKFHSRFYSTNLSYLNTPPFTCKSTNSPPPLIQPRPLLINTYGSSELVKYNRKLKAFGSKSSKYADIETVLDEVKASGLIPDWETYHYLILSLSKVVDLENSTRFQLCLNFIDDFLKANLNLDSAILNLALDLSHTPESTNYVLSLFESYRVPLSASSYSTLLGVLYRQDNFEALFLTYSKLINENVSLNSMCHEIIMKAHFKLDQINQAYDIWVNQFNDLSIEANTLILWLSRFAQKYHLTASFELLNLTVNRNLTLDQGLLLQLLDVANVYADFNLVTLTLTQLGKMKVELTTLHYIPIIATYIKAGGSLQRLEAWPRALHVLNVSTKMGVCNFASPLAQLVAPELTENIQKIQELETFLKEENYHGNALWLTVFEAYKLCGKNESAIATLDFITKASSDKEATDTIGVELINSSLDIACQTKKIDQLSKILEIADNLEISLNSISYHKLISFTIKKALENVGLENEQEFNSHFNDQAWEYLQIAKTNGFKMYYDTYNLLAKHYKKTNDYRLNKLVEQMEADGYKFIERNLAENETISF